MKILQRLLASSLVALAFASPAQAADTAAPAQPIDTSAPARQTAPVVLANRTIIVLRGPIAGYSARERANSAMRHIDGALESEESPAVSTEDTEDGTQVLLGSKLAFLVTRIDIDPLIGETTQNVAREAGKRLERAVTQYREQHTPRYLLIQTGWAALATAIFAAVLWLLFIVDRWAGRRVAAAAAARAERVHVHGVSLLDPYQMRWVARRLFAALIWAVGLLATYGWLTFTLKLFPYTRPWGEHMEGNLLEIVGDVALAIVNAIPGLLVVVVIVLIARLIIRFANIFFDRVQRGSITMWGLDPDTVVPTRRIFQIVVLAFALALSYPYLPGSDTEAFKGVSVLVGLMVSIGASSLVGQAVSGLILTYTRAFRPGEYVRIGDTEGTVVGIGAFSTRVRTGLGEEVMVPNSLALQNTTKNFSRAFSGTGFVVNTSVTIGYSTPWRQVHAMLEEAARRTNDIARDPAPYVRQTALSDFYVVYHLIAYSPIDHPVKRIDMLSELHANIQDVFNEHGVQIMSPHYMTETAEPQVVPKERWYEAPAKPSASTGGDAGAKNKP
ncbi:MAG TPA: mechanosensitive ion channel domain-containing protein [Casimicrobiaceae bacterium]|nr:mechanosensitive ion channel domain-containing protein [Casimicrobiaceae bacterium]